MQLWPLREGDGVIPEALTQDEVVHTGLTHLEVVASMHERKARMLDLADAAVAMPGGLGTSTSCLKL